MTTLDQLAADVSRLTQAIILSARVAGRRLTRAEMCERYGVCSKTLTNRVRMGVIPAPASDGRWLLAEVMHWEARGLRLNELNITKDYK